jgi:hypothetical protein
MPGPAVCLYPANASPCRPIYTDNVGQVGLCLGLLCAYILLALARDVLPCLLVVIGLQGRHGFTQHIKI